MAPTFSHGKGAFISISSATGGVINFSSGLDTAELARQCALAETPTFGDNDMTRIPGLRDVSISAGGIFSSTHAKKLDPLLGHTTASSVIFGPEGNTAGDRKYLFSAWLTSYSVSAPVQDKVTISLDLAGTGAVTSTNY